MNRNDNEPAGSEWGLLVFWSAAMFALGCMCGLVLAPVVLRALA